MEPCLFRHGKELVAFSRLQNKDGASMEPCLFRHGKGAPPAAMSCQNWLQWSHVFSDMVRAHLYMRTLKADKRCHKNVVTVPGY